MITKEEMVDIIFLSNHLAKIDGFLQKSEKRIILELIEKAGLNQEELIQELDKRLSLDKAVKNIQSGYAKKALIDSLVLIANADGNFDSNENQFITKIMKRLQVDPDAHPFFAPDAPLNIEKIRFELEEALKMVK